MGGGTHGGDAPAPPRLQIAGRIKPGDECRARRGHGGVLSCAARSHLGQWPVAGGQAHSSRRRRDCGIVIEDAERERFEHHALGERCLDGEHGGAGKIQLALAVAADGAGEPIVGEPCEGCGIHHLICGEPFDLGVAEAEVAQGRKKPPGASHDAEAAAAWQPAREELEHATPVRGAIAQGGGEHSELVAIRAKGTAAVRCLDHAVSLLRHRGQRRRLDPS